MSQKPKRERAGARVVLVMLLVLGVLLGGGYVAAYAGAQDKVPRGTRVADVQVGGRTLVEAAAALRAGLSPRAEAPITIDVDGKKITATPAELGLGVDYIGSVREAGAGRSWDPAWLWNYYTGGEELGPLVTVAEMTMTDYLAGLTQSVGTPARDGRVRFQGTRVRVDQAKVGRSIDPAQAREAILAAYLTDDPTAVVERVASTPDIDDADVRAAVNDIANPAVSAPVTLVFGDSRVRLQPRDFVAALSLRPRNGALRLHVEQETLLGLVHQVVAADGGAPQDATVALVDGRPKVIPSKPGVRFEPAEVTAAFTAALTRPEGEREATVTAEVEKAAFTTKDARALKIKEEVSTFTTYFPYAEYRNTNIGRAMELINGTLLKPGETFSLNDTVGERTPENGFVEGLHHRGRHLQGGLRRRRLAVGHDHLQRGVLRRPRRRRAQDRTRSTSTATRSAARPRWPGRRSTSSSPTTPPTGSSSSPGSPRAAPPRRAAPRSRCGRRSTGRSPPPSPRGTT